MHRDAEMADVVVVLEELETGPMQEVVKQLEAAGLAVSQVDDVQSVVEGSVEAHKVADLKAVGHVRYVRTTMHYCAEYPPGHPLDKNQM